MKIAELFFIGGGEGGDDPSTGQLGGRLLPVKLKAPSIL